MVNVWARCRLFIRLQATVGAVARSSPAASCWCGRQVAQSDQVVGRQCEAEHPIDSRNSAMAGLAQPAYGLDPAEDLFHSLTLALTNHVARMASGALVNNTGWLAREVRGNRMLAHFLNKLLAVIALVGTQGDAMPARNLLYHRQRRLWFGAPGSLSYAAVDRQPMAILHQHMAGIAELRLLAFPLARQPRFRIGSRLVAIVAALLAVKVHARIARILVVRRGLARFGVFALETFLPRPGFDQRAVDREVLVGEQLPPVGLRQ